MMCFRLDASMVHTSMLVVATDGESIEFITDYFGGLSVSPKGRGGNKGVIFMGATYSESPSLRAMIEDSPMSSTCF
jgi:hypothetical protein